MSSVSWCVSNFSDGWIGPFPHSSLRDFQYSYMALAWGMMCASPSWFNDGTMVS